MCAQVGNAHYGICICERVINQEGSSTWRIIGSVRVKMVHSRILLPVSPRNFFGNFILTRLVEWAFRNSLIYFYMCYFTLSLYNLNRAFAKTRRDVTRQCFKVGHLAILVPLKNTFTGVPWNPFMQASAVVKVNKVIRVGNVIERPLYRDVQNILRCYRRTRSIALKTAVSDPVSIPARCLELPRQLWASVHLICPALFTTSTAPRPIPTRAWFCRTHAMMLDLWSTPNPITTWWLPFRQPHVTGARPRDRWPVCSLGCLHGRCGLQGNRRAGKTDPVVVDTMFASETLIDTLCGGFAVIGLVIRVIICTMMVHSTPNYTLFLWITVFVYETDLIIMLDHPLVIFWDFYVSIFSDLQPPYLCEFAHWWSYLPPKYASSKGPVVSEPPGHGEIANEKIQTRERAEGGFLAESKPPLAVNVETAFPCSQALCLRILCCATCALENTEMCFASFRVIFAAVFSVSTVHKYHHWNRRMAKRWRSSEHDPNSRKTSPRPSQCLKRYEQCLWLCLSSQRVFSSMQLNYFIPVPQRHTYIRVCTLSESASTSPCSLDYLCYSYHVLRWDGRSGRPHRFATVLQLCAQVISG